MKRKISMVCIFLGTIFLVVSCIAYRFNYAFEVWSILFIVSLSLGLVTVFAKNNFVFNIIITLVLLFLIIILILTKQAVIMLMGCVVVLGLALKKYFSCKYPK